MRFLILIAACFSTSASVAESLVSGGHQEAVFSVSDIDSWTDFFEEIADWEVIHNGAVEHVILAAWDLPAAVSAREVLVGNPGTERGYVRLIQFEGAAQQQIRSNAQSWDTGGIFDVNSRVLDMQQKFADLQGENWQAVSDPVEFSFGPFVVKEWLARGPDGIVIALIERVQPPLEGHPHLREMGRLINSTQIVSDIEEARDFYMSKLGFQSNLEHNGTSMEAGPNVLGLPHNLAAKISRSVSILHPQGLNEGSVELLQFEGATGVDFSLRAVPPNLGILMLRFPVSDMSAFFAHIESQGIEIAVPVTETLLPPYGHVALMAIRGPGGVWLEFFEKIKQDEHTGG